MIRNYRHKGLENFVQSGTTKGIVPQHAKRIAVRIDTMQVATELQEVNQPGYEFHPLKGDREGEYSIHVNGPWSITFKWDEEAKEFYDVNYEQYH